MPRVTSNMGQVLGAVGELKAASRERIGVHLRLQGFHIEPAQVGHALKGLGLRRLVRTVRGVDKGPYVQWELNPRGFM